MAKENYLVAIIAVVPGHALAVVRSTPSVRSSVNLRLLPVERNIGAHACVNDYVRAEINHQRKLLQVS